MRRRLKYLNKKRKKIYRNPRSRVYKNFWDRVQESVPHFTSIDISSMQSGMFFRNLIHCGSAKSRIFHISGDTNITVLVYTPPRSDMIKTTTGMKVYQHEKKTEKTFL